MGGATSRDTDTLTAGRSELPSACAHLTRAITNLRFSSTEPSVRTSSKHSILAVISGFRRR